MKENTIWIKVSMAMVLSIVAGQSSGMQESGEKKNIIVQSEKLRFDKSLDFAQSSPCRGKSTMEPKPKNSIKKSV